MIILNATSTNFQLPIEVICTLITLCGTIISAVISWFVSRYSTNKEIEKLKLTWEREDVVSSDDEFAAMISDIAELIFYDCPEQKRETLSKVAAARSKESGTLATSLDDIYYAIREDDKREMERVLFYLIEEKRKAKRNADAKVDKKPSK